MDQLDQPVRRGGRIRRLPRERVRARGRTRGDVRVPEDGVGDGDGRGRAGARVEAARSAGAVRPLRRAASSTTPIAVPADRPHGQAVHRRQAGAPRLRLLAPHRRRRTAQSLGEVGEGNRKDIRNAVEAAHAARRAGRKATGHKRAQILYYIAENLAARARRVRARASPRMTGAATTRASAKSTRRSRGCSPTRAWADKYDGAVHSVPIRGVALAMNEPIGVIGIACPDEHPLLGFVSLVAPAIAMGNTVVAIPSRAHPARRDRLLSGARDVRRAGRRDQHRHRRDGRAREDAGRARRRGRGVVLRVAATA